MIRINLLPEEFRTPDGPPPGRMLVISASLVVLGIAFSTWVVLVFVKTPQVREERNHLRQAFGKAKQDLPRISELEQQAADLAAQRAAVGALFTQRESWSQRLEELSAAVAEQRVWVDEWHAVSRPDSGGYRWELRIDFATADVDEGHALLLRKILTNSGYASPWAAIDGAALQPFRRDYSGPKAKFVEKQHYRYSLVHRSAPRAAKKEGE